MVRRGAVCVSPWGRRGARRVASSLHLDLDGGAAPHRGDISRGLRQRRSRDDTGGRRNTTSVRSRGCGDQAIAKEAPGCRTRPRDHASDGEAPCTNTRTTAVAYGRGHHRTWIAVVDERATKVNGDERLVLPMDPNLTPLDAMRAAVESQPTRCIWLEFYPDFSGFRYACRVVEDVTTPLAIIDRRTNEDTPLGARFSWTPSVLDTAEMEFEERLILPASLDGKRPEIEVRHWRLEYAGRDDNGSRMSEFFAETGFLSDFVYTWTIGNDFI